MNKLWVLSLFATLHLVPTTVLARSGSDVWLGPDGAPLPFLSDDEAEDFLGSARVIATKELATGVNKALKLRLELDGVQANAVFRTVDKKRKSVKLGRKRIRDFHDSYLYECAAYELSRMLGIDRVPPCVLREIDGRQGSIQLWVENARTEVDHRHNTEGPRAEIRWPETFQTMRLFDALIDNFDRHPGNILVDGHDRVWFIDHTRSFRLYSSAAGLDEIATCDRDVWQKLKSLEKSALASRLAPYVGFRHIDAVMRRRDQIVRHIESLVEDRGEAAVFF